MLKTTHTTLCGSTVEVWEDNNNNNRTLYATTPCCRAAATGTTDGVCCKNCYKPVNDLYGTSGLGALIQSAKDHNCPEPENCARHTTYFLRG